MKKGYESTRDSVRRKIHRWMRTANGEKQWRYRRAECEKMLKREANKLLLKNPNAKVTDLPTHVLTTAYAHMYFLEDIKIKFF